MKQRRALFLVAWCQSLPLWYLGHARQGIAQLSVLVAVRVASPMLAFDFGVIAARTENFGPIFRIMV